MTRRIVVLVAALSLSLSITSVAMSDEHIPPHPHMLVQHIQYDDAGEPVGFGRCVDLAANRKLPLGSQHEHMHFGTAGEALSTKGKASHWVVPAAPAFDLPWANCEEFSAIISGG